MLSNVFGEIKGVLNCIIVRSKWFEQRIGPNLRQPLTKGLWILDSPHIMPCWEPWGLVNRYKCDDLDKVIFTYFLYKLSDLEKRLLAKGLKYALPPIKLNYGDYMTPFELFIMKYGNCPLKIMNQEKLRQRLKTKHIRRLITIIFGMRALGIILSALGRL